MLLLASHLLAFTVLAVNSLYDIFNSHDVPDLPGLIGIAGGILLHAVYAWQISSLTPLVWCLGVGAAFSVYGWTAYWRGMWGGADAMTLSALGFTAAGPVSGIFGISYTLDLITNFMLSSVAVTLLYSGYKFVDQGGELQDIYEAVRERELTVSGIVAAGGVLGFLLNTQGLNGLGFFLLISASSFIFVFLKLVQDEYMIVEKEPEEVEAGDVASPGQGFGRKIRGLKEEEVEEVSEPLEVRTGVPFIPVFLLALILTDLTSSGFWLLYSIY